MISIPVPQTDRAPADARPQRVLLESLRPRLGEHLAVVDGGQPVRVGGGEEVAASHPVALDERSRSEVRQTRPGADQRLAAALGTGVGVL